mmetsp:Transcript_34804/g.39673  ORF Transcript_34804/g.39673 Transcript_34804/m.39673 type:complete len:317 (+) Transcript_34804:97-1047(+)|eukprot:CAMPEP_0194129450 /NCGR_PEP_ID=MMETSP0152-20130528/671_1 /TAXON_ID=1049557 /ORGANISM="Thalassiothrix antarctica, Strain L6-D1" /LENGTH=316 /DNA_ID=CAMNT_0038823641 /DNA_START=81 /DNA_END=1031 /DNA_ORIENTATION=-
MRLSYLFALLVVACNSCLVSAFIASPPPHFKNHFEISKAQRRYARTTQAERDLVTYQKKIRECKSFRQLKRLQERGARKYDGPNVSFYWSQVARFIKKGPQSDRIKRNPVHLKPIADKTIKYKDVITAPEHLAAIAHAIGKISFYTNTTIYESEKVWEVLENNILEAAKTAGSFSTRQSAIIVWALAKLGRKSDAILAAMEAQLLSNIDDINAQGVGNVVWASAKLGYSSPKLFDALSSQATAKLETFNSHELANVKWGFEKLGHSAPALIDTITTQIESKKGETLNIQNRKRAAAAEAAILAQKDEGIYMPWKKD